MALDAPANHTVPDVRRRPAGGPHGSAEPEETEKKRPALNLEVGGYGENQNRGGGSQRDARLTFDTTRLVLELEAGLPEYGLDAEVEVEFEHGGTGAALELEFPPPVEDSTLRALEDPEDRNKDGFSGRLNEVWDTQARALAPGRFGKKANSPNLLQQSAEAYLNDMGVTTPLFPEPDGTHELPRETLEAAAFDAQALAVTALAAIDDPEVHRRENLFRSTGCAQCHLEMLRTGEHPLAELSHQTIHPYTDLLLHPMGPGLADGRPDGVAAGDEWRTQTVLPYSGYLHDGRARL